MSAAAAKMGPRLLSPPFGSVSLWCEAGRGQTPWPVGRGAQRNAPCLSHGGDAREMLPGKAPGSLAHILQWARRGYGPVLKTAHPGMN